MVIRIAYIINYIVKNGPSNVVLNIINNLDRKKYSISLITLFSGNDPDVISYLKTKGISVYECTTLNRLKCLLGICEEFDKIIKDSQFDILHTHGIIPDIISSKLNVPVKKICTIHNNMFEDYLSCYGTINSKIFITLHLNALKKIDTCVCCSKSVWLAMKQKLNNTVYIYNGIEPIRPLKNITRIELGIPENAIVLLYSGVLSSRKNVVWLIENFVKYHDNNEYLIILGTGEKELECLSKTDSHVKMLGFKSNPSDYMNISNIYVSASQSEGFSISVLEALSSGLLLLLSNIPSHKEIIDIQKRVYIGEIFDEGSFNQKLKILRNKRYIREEITQFQRNELSAEKMAKQYEHFYLR